MLQGRVRIELLDDFGRIGDLDGGTIDGQYPESAPFSKGEVLLEEAHQFLTQLDESQGSELGSSASERAFGDFAEWQFGVVNGLEECVQFDLQRAFDEIETEEDEAWKWEAALSGEVLRSGSMSIKKFWGVNDFLEMDE